jgi:asparagine synthase (glutamine-hydrolysing)
VLLDGVGGDEWLSGSSYYYAGLITDLSFTGLLRQIRSDLKSIGAMSTLSEVLWHGINPLFPRRVRDGVKWALQRKPELPAWIDTGFARRIGLAERIWKVPSRLSFSHVACGEIWRSSANGFHAHAHETEERAASWLGFEQRHPFYDRRLVEFTLALPEEQRYRQGWIKYVLRLTMEDYLPETVRQRWDKAEFSHLFGNMLEGQAIAELFDMLAIASIGWVDRQAVREMYQKMMRLYRQGDDVYKPYVWKLWAIAGVELWYNRAFLNRGALAFAGRCVGETDSEPALVAV